MRATVTDPGKLKAADYRLSFEGNVYTLENTITQSRQEFTQLPIEVDGLHFEVASGAMASGDAMMIQAGSAYAGRMRSVLSRGDGIAAARPLTAVEARSNQGDAYMVSLAQVSPNANFDKPVTLSFTGPNTFDITGEGGTATGLAYAPGQPIEFNGWRLVLNGVPQAGDTVELVKPVAVTKDNGNARELVSLADQELVDGMRFSEAFTAVLSDVGGRTLQAKTADRASTRMLEGAKALMADRSGVNLDEEAARLLQYRQAYQAAAKVIQTADEMFNSILSLAR